MWDTSIDSLYCFSCANYNQIAFNPKNNECESSSQCDPAISIENRDPGYCTQTCGSTTQGLDITENCFTVNSGDANQGCGVGRVFVNGMCRNCHNQRDWFAPASVASPVSQDVDLCKTCSFDHGVTTCTSCNAGYYITDTTVAPTGCVSSSDCTNLNGKIFGGLPTKCIICPEGCPLASCALDGNNNPYCNGPLNT